MFLLSLSFTEVFSPALYKGEAEEILRKNQSSEHYLNTSFSPKRCRREGGWNCKGGLPYIFWVSNAQNDAEGEHGLVCPAVNTEAISLFHYPPSSKKNQISVSLHWKKLREISRVCLTYSISPRNRIVCVLNPSLPTTPFPSLTPCREKNFFFFMLHQLVWREGSSCPTLQTAALCLAGLPGFYILFSMTELLEEIQHEKPSSLPPSWLVHTGSTERCVFTAQAGRESTG